MLNNMLRLFILSDMFSDFGKLSLKLQTIRTDPTVVYTI
jgi:hypothetical protein